MCFRADLFRCHYETSERQRGGSEQPRDLIRKQSRGCVFPLNNFWAQLWAGTLQGKGQYTPVLPQAERSSAARDMPKREASAVCPNLPFFWQRRVSINTHLLPSRSKAIFPGHFWRPYKVKRNNKSSNEMQKSLMKVYRRK